MPSSSTPRLSDAGGNAGGNPGDAVDAAVDHLLDVVKPRLRGWLRLAAVRIACGALVLGFGVTGLLRAAGGLPPSWLHLVCLAP